MAPTLTRLLGHFWTISPVVWDRLVPRAAPASVPWHVDIPDAQLRSVRVRGTITHEPGADTLLLVVHGLGGNSESPYARAAARAAHARGWSCLRIDLRGADGLGEDLYHAGLSSDLGHALAEPSCAGYERVVVVGYSLGGHVALHYAAGAVDPRVLAVAAVCAPLDLARSARALDRRRAYPYRRFVLEHLHRAYRQVAERRPVATPVDEVMRTRSLRAWDAAAVVPRFGFADVDDYYARASVGPRLSALAVPALWIGTRHDPMVTEQAVLPSLQAAGSGLTTKWIEHGGHVGVPAYALGVDLETAVLDWLARARR